MRVRLYAFPSSSSFLLWAARNAVQFNVLYHYITGRHVGVGSLRGDGQYSMTRDKFWHPIRYSYRVCLRDAIRYAEASGVFIQYFTEGLERVGATGVLHCAGTLNVSLTQIHAFGSMHANSTRN